MRTRLQIILGTGLISIEGSSIVNYYITRRLSREEKVYEHIHETYLSKGLYPIEAALSVYGTALTTAFVDLHKEAAHYIEDLNLGMRLEPIRARAKTKTKKTISPVLPMLTSYFGQFGLPNDE